MIDDYARSAKEVEEVLQGNANAAELMKVRAAKLIATYQALKEYPIYQGLTTDGIREPRAVVILLRPRMEMWANYINHKAYYE